MIYKKINLKKISKKDIISDYINWMNDYEVVKFTEQKYFKHTKKNIKNFLEKINKDKYSLIYGIFFDDLLLGTVKIGNINQIHKTADISYIIGNKKFWNKGIGSIVVRKICLIAFKQLKLKKLIAGTYSVAIASQKVLKKNGFKQEGILKSQIYFNKKRLDHYIYGLKNVNFR